MSVKDILKQHRRQSKQDLVHEALAEKRSNDFKRDYYKKIDDGVAAVPLEIKRKFIALMKEGKNLGTAMREVGIEDLSIAAKIFQDSIGTYEFLKNPEDIT